MIVRVDARLREEAARHRLAFSCDRCAQYDPERDACAFGFPVEPHRSGDLTGRDELLFCKAFELA